MIRGDYSTFPSFRLDTTSRTTLPSSAAHQGSMLSVPSPPGTPLHTDKSTRKIHVFYGRTRPPTNHSTQVIQGLAEGAIAAALAVSLIIAFLMCGYKYMLSKKNRWNSTSMMPTYTDQSIPRSEEEQRAASRRHDKAIAAANHFVKHAPEMLESLQQVRYWCGGNTGKHTHHSTHNKNEIALQQWRACEYAISRGEYSMLNTHRTQAFTQPPITQSSHLPASSSLEHFSKQATLEGGDRRISDIASRASKIVHHYHQELERMVGGISSASTL